MLLAVDIGNTSVKIGLYNGSDSSSTWRTESNFSDNEGLDFPSIQSWLSNNNVKLVDIENIALASVVPHLTDTVSKSLKDYFNANLLIIDSKSTLGINIEVDNPAEVGIDRIINAISAIQILSTPIIVIDFGTATTFDVVDKKGDYIGGTIAPGIDLSSRVLTSNAAKLPQISLEFPSKWIGKNTIESMQSGLMNGYLGLVEGMVNGINEELGQSANVVPTGGLATSIAQKSNSIEMVVPHLTLDGIKRIWELNS